MNYLKKDVLIFLQQYFEQFVIIVHTAIFFLIEWRKICCKTHSKLDFVFIIWKIKSHLQINFIYFLSIVRRENVLAKRNRRMLLYLQSANISYLHLKYRRFPEIVLILQFTEQCILKLNNQLLNNQTTFNTFTDKVLTARMCLKE